MSAGGSDEGASAWHGLIGAEPVRTRRVNPLLLAGALYAAMLAYYFLIAWRGFYLIMEDRWLLKALGIAVVMVPAVGVMVVMRELRFDVACQLLLLSVRRTEGPVELPALPTLAAGPTDRRVLDAWLEQHRDAARQAPQDWRCWFRLGHAYHLAGDRKRAREALRTAISTAPRQRRRR